MKLSAIIFDIYKTLLEVGPPPGDANQRWETLWLKTFGSAARLNLEAFDAECKRIIVREHTAARALGIAYPEIFWPAVVEEIFPELLNLPKEARDEFLYQHAQLQRTVCLMDGAGEALQRLAKKDFRLGIASNSQPYTLYELDSALATAGLNQNMFAANLSFFSFANGFSKPDPHVFHLLTARLQNLGISPREILMVGDRLDNDIAPARAAGWQTWHLHKIAGDNAGDWQEFINRFCGGR